MLRRRVGEALRHKGCDDSFLRWSMLRLNPSGRLRRKLPWTLHFSAFHVQIPCPLLKFSLAPKNFLPKPQKQWTAIDRILANQDKRMKSIIISHLLNDTMKAVIKCFIRNRIRGILHITLAKVWQRNRLEMLVSADGIKWFLLAVQVVFLLIMFLLVMFSFLLTDIESADLIYIYSVPCKSKAASVPAGSRNSSASVTAGGSDPAASRNRPAVNSAGRPNPTGRVGQAAHLAAAQSNPAGWSKRPAPISAGRPVSAGWLNPAARPYFRPSSVYFNNMYWPGFFKHETPPSYSKFHLKDPLQNDYHDTIWTRNELLNFKTFELIKYFLHCFDPTGFF
ncbi:hypothetical protein Tco_1571012 [Tanacetum coccineum]